MWFAPFPSPAHRTGRAGFWRPARRRSSPLCSTRPHADSAPNIPANGETIADTACGDETKIRTRGTREALAALSLSPVWISTCLIDSEAGLIRLTTPAHSSGRAIVGMAGLRYPRNGDTASHGGGTYARRYALLILVGICGRRRSRRAGSQPEGRRAGRGGRPEQARWGASRNNAR
jgi:hypothetical protein